MWLLNLSIISSYRELKCGLLHEEDEYIVYKSCIWELFKMCTTCSRPSDVTIINTVGTFISTKQSCFHCMYSQVWSSQSKINRIPAGNLLLSAAISFSGSLYTKILRLMKSMNVLMIGESTFQEHATMYQHPVIWNVWQSQQQQLISQLQYMQGSLLIGGDGRADTPGHCAKYGQYTMMELRLNKITDFQLVQVTKSLFKAYFVNFGSFFHEEQYSGHKDIVIAGLLVCIAYSNISIMLISKVDYSFVH